MSKSIFKFGDKFGVESPFGDYNNSEFQRPVPISLDRRNVIEPSAATDSIGEHGRITFRHNKIYVHLDLRFYGFGFKRIYDAMYAGTLNRFLQSDHLAYSVYSKLKRYKFYENDERNDPKIVMQFMNEMVAEQVHYLELALNDYDTFFPGPDDKSYPVKFDVRGQFISETETIHLLKSNVSNKKIENINCRTGLHVKNNSLIFIRVEALNITAQNSILPSLCNRTVKSPDNSALISTLHLSTTTLTHEIIAHMFWGRGNSPLIHLNGNWNKNPEGYSFPSIRFVDFEANTPSSIPVIEGLPDYFKIPRTERLNKDFRRVLPPDKKLSPMANGHPMWNKARNTAWHGDGSNTYFRYENGQLDQVNLRNNPQWRSKKKGSLINIWGVLRWIIIVLTLSSCVKSIDKANENISFKNTSDCESDKILYEEYRRKVWLDDKYNAQGMFDFMCDEPYTTSFLMEHLGRPLYINKYASDDSPTYESWVYPTEVSIDDASGNYVIVSVLVIYPEQKGDIRETLEAFHIYYDGRERPMRFEDWNSHLKDSCSNRYIRWLSD